MATKSTSKVPQVGAFPLPEWIDHIEHPTRMNLFVVDPDKFYPAYLAELGIDEPTQFDLEVCFGLMKREFNLAVQITRAAVPKRTIENTVRADDGRKLRWNLTQFPVGKVDWSILTLGERARHINEAWAKIRG